MRVRKWISELTLAAVPSISSHTWVAHHTAHGCDCTPHTAHRTLRYRTTLHCNWEGGGRNGNAMDKNIGGESDKRVQKKLLQRSAEYRRPITHLAGSYRPEARGVSDDTSA